MTHTLVTKTRTTVGLETVLGRGHPFWRKDLFSSQRVLTHEQKKPLRGGPFVRSSEYGTLLCVREGPPTRRIVTTLPRTGRDWERKLHTFKERNLPIVEGILSRPGRTVRLHPSSFLLTGLFFSTFVTPLREVLTNQPT